MGKQEFHPLSVCGLVLLATGWSTALGCGDDELTALGPDAAADTTPPAHEDASGAEAGRPPFGSSATRLLAASRSTHEFLQFDTNGRVTGIEPVFGGITYGESKLSPNHRWLAVHAADSHALHVRNVDDSTPTRTFEYADMLADFFVDDEGHVYAQITTSGGQATVTRDGTAIADGYLREGYARGGLVLVELFGGGPTLVDLLGATTPLAGVSETLEWSNDGRCVRIDDEAAIAHRICADGSDLELGPTAPLWISPNASWFVDSSTRPMRVIETSSGTVTEQLTNAVGGTILFTPDGARAYSLGDGAVWSFARSSPEVAVQLTTATQPSGTFVGGVFGADGTLVLLERTPDGTRSVWLVSGTTLSRLHTAAAGKAIQVAFAPSAKRIVLVEEASAWVECDVATRTCTAKPTANHLAVAPKWLDDDTYAFGTTTGPYGARWGYDAFLLAGAPADAVPVPGATQCWRPRPDGVACEDQVESIPID